jgi:hypothetical protein
MKRQNLIAALSTLTIIAAANLLNAGPLSPPLGPVVSTFKTLTEVEPRIAVNATNTPGGATATFRITQPGSYYLTGNIAGVAGKHGVEIAASGVTLDLNGFDLVGFVGLGVTDGVKVTVSNLTNIAVLNGSVRNWGDDGVDLGRGGALNTTNFRVESVLASGNRGNGITGCNGSTLSNCSASANVGSGITTGDGCTVVNCTAYENGRNGIEVGNGSTVLNCASRHNSIHGIECSFACIIRGNTCSRNGNGGDGAGIRVTNEDNRIEGNNCTGADRGIDVGAVGNIIIKNTCASNTLDWTIAANNVVGPILDRRAPASAAISGFSAPDSTGSAHPNANFSY